jgi:hypothetical protein
MLNRPPKGRPFNSSGHRSINRFALLQDDAPSQNMVAHRERKSSPVVFDKSFVDLILPDRYQTGTIPEMMGFSEVKLPRKKRGKSSKDRVMIPKCPFPVKSILALNPRISLSLVCATSPILVRNPEKKVPCRTRKTCCLQYG